MKRFTSITFLVLLLLGSLLESEAMAIVLTQIDRDYSVVVAGERYGVQDYSGWGWGNAFAGTHLYLGPLGKRSLSVDARQALAIAAAITVTVLTGCVVAWSQLRRRE